jgi:predicted DNA-binding protein with PD1-like motif
VQTVEDRDHILVSFSRSEEVPEQLTRFCAARGFGHAAVEGIGALEEITIGAYDLEARSYRKQELPGGWEVLAFNGNFSWVSGEPLLHAHVTLADLDGQVRGGHLFAGRVHVTLELVLRPGKARVERALDERVGLKLWRLQS